MDTLTWATAIVAGAAAGVLCGLVPGFHTNTLAALLLALAPGAGAWGAHALLAAVASHTFVSILPSTYVGVPGDEAGLSVLPAHRLLRDGKGREAVRIAADAALGATMAAVLLILPFKWLTAEPGRAIELLEGALPSILLGVLALLLWQERHKGPAAVGAAGLCLAASGTLGWIATGLRVTALVPLPATTLLPLLSGLFGMAGLLHSAAANAAVPDQDPAPKRLPRATGLQVAGACLRGVAAAGWTAATPGLTSAVGASVALAGAARNDPRVPLACLNAVGAAHQVFALALLWLTLRARTGTAIAVQDLSDVQAWTAGRAPTGLLLALATLVAASLLGHVALQRMDARMAAWLLRANARRASLAAAAGLALIVLVLSGPLGMLLLAAATTVGLVPLAFGVRRVHLTGALIVPALLFHWDLA